MSSAPKASRRRRAALIACAIVLGLAALVRFGNGALRLIESDAPSRSIGTTANGRLENGKRMPSGGPNWRTYSHLGSLLGRQCVHGALRSCVLDAYAALGKSAPDQRFVLGETGWPSGGPFPPHRTHRNGLSVDFMVPLRAATTGKPRRFPTAPWTRFGYDLEFDAAGRRGSSRIDFEAIALHLQALHDAGPRHGVRIARVILTPEYLPLLRATEAGRRLPRDLPFMTRPAWIRHDEHYHVDFEVVR